MQKLLKQIQKQVPSYNFALRHPSRKPTIQHLENVQIKKDMKVARKQLYKEYWEHQTIVENQYIENFMLQQNEKAKNDELKFRTGIVNVAFATQNQINKIRDREDKNAKKQEKYILQSQVQKMNRQKVLKLLTKESENWYNQANIEEKMTEELLIPEQVFNESDYYLKLQEQALLLEQGELDLLEDSIFEKKAINDKNKLLIPIYMQVISIVKHFLNTDIGKLQNDHKHALVKLYKNHKNETEEFNKQKELLNGAYNELINKIYEESNKPQNKLEKLQNDAILLYNLLSKWNEYMSILKMSNTQIQVLMDSEEYQQNLDLVENHGVDQKEEKKWSSTLTSSSEDEQSQSDKEIDLNKTEQTQEQKDALKQQIDSVIEKVDNQKDTDETDEMDEKLDQLFKEVTSKQTQKRFDLQFEDMLIQQIHNNRMMYGLTDQKQSQDGKEFLNQNDIENIIPQNLIDSATDFDSPKLQYETLEDIEQHETGYQKLNSSVIIEYFKQDIEQFALNENLSRQNKTKLQKLQKVITILGEVPVKEPKLLLKIWTLYKNRL